MRCAIGKITDTMPIGGRKPFRERIRLLYRKYEYLFPQQYAYTTKSPIVNY